MTGIINYLPAAKLGNNTFIYIWSGGPIYPSQDSKNYFGLSQLVLAVALVRHHTLWGSRSNKLIILMQK
jgi:hypothetical protein